MTKFQNESKKNSSITVTTVTESTEQLIDQKRLKTEENKKESES